MWTYCASSVKILNLCIASLKIVTKVLLKYWWAKISHFTRLRILLWISFKITDNLCQINCAFNILIDMDEKKLYIVILMRAISGFFCKSTFSDCLGKTLPEILQFHLISWCGNFVEMHLFHRVSLHGTYAVKVL